MISISVGFLVMYWAEVTGSLIASPQIRILDVADRTSETRVLANRLNYRYVYPEGLRKTGSDRPLKSYVIYDQYPYKIFKEWKGNNAGAGKVDEKDHASSFQQAKRHNPEFGPEQYFPSGQRVFSGANPTLAYQSVYSNVIRVFENSFGDDDQKSNFPAPYAEEHISTVLQPPFQTFYPRVPFQDQRYPDNFPKIFIPNERFPFSTFPVKAPSKPPFTPNRHELQDDFKVNRLPGVKGNKGPNKNSNDDAEVIPEIEVNVKNRKRVVLCSFIRLNNKKFPEDGGPCARTENGSPLLLPEYPDYSGLPDDKIPMEHRRQHAQSKRMKRSLLTDETGIAREKRGSNFGYGYESWGSPFDFDGGFNGYFNDFYSGQNGRDNFGNYGRNRYRNQGGRNRNNDYYDGYQAGDNSNSRGLSSFLNNGGRRYKNRNNDNDNDGDNNDDYRNNDDNDNDDDYYDDNNNNNDYDSDNNGDNQNDRRRGSNGRRNNNENSRNRRRNNNNNNNNNNNDNDYDDNNSNYGNNNNNNNNRNNRRNNRNRQNNNSRRNNNNNRNRNGYGNSYGNNNGYNGYNSYNGYSSYGNNNGYGNYGGYGGGNNGYGGYGSGSSRGYGGSSYGNYGNNGYGSNNYGNNGGYGYSSGGYGGSGGGFGYFGQGDF